MIVGPLGSDDVTPREESSPQSEGAVSDDVVITGGQDTQVKPDRVFAFHMGVAIVDSIPYVAITCKILL